MQLQSRKEKNTFVNGREKMTGTNVIHQKMNCYFKFRVFRECKKNSVSAIQKYVKVLISRRKTI